MNNLKVKRRVALTLIIVMMIGLFPSGFTAFAVDFADGNYSVGPESGGYVNSDLGFPTDTNEGNTREYFTFYLDAGQIPDGEYETTIDAAKLFYFDGTDYEPYDDEIQVEITVDRTAPRVEEITGSIKEGIKIGFSKEIDPSSFAVTFQDAANTQNYGLSNFTATWEADYTGVLLEPGNSMALQNDTSYTITVTACEDIAGLMATIMVKDAVNGTIDRLHPEIVVNFNNTVPYINNGIVNDSAMLAPSNEFIFLRTASGSKVPCDYTVSADFYTVTLTPKNPLLRGEAYTVVVRDLTNAQGDPMTRRTESFTVLKASPFISITPAADSVQTSLNEIANNFSEEVFRANGASLSQAYMASNITVTCNGTAASVNYIITGPNNNTFVTFEADSQLPDGMYYVVIDGDQITYGAEERILGFRNQVFEIDATEPAIFVTPVNNATVSYTLGQFIIQFSIDKQLFCGSDGVSGEILSGSGCPS